MSRSPPLALEVAVLAVDFVLMHKASFVKVCSSGDGKGAENVDASSQSGANCQKPGLSHESTRMCNYCCGEGHWKDQCPVFKIKAKSNLPLHASACLCSPCVSSSEESVKMTVWTLGLAQRKCQNPGVGSSELSGKPLFVQTQMRFLVLSCSFLMLWCSWSVMTVFRSSYYVSQV